MRILILEDDPSVATFLEEVLRKNGHEPTSFGHGGLALGAIARGRFELLISDLMLPNLSGIEIMRMARTQFPYLPIIAMSADDREEKRQESINAGASCFISKPIRIETLLEELIWVKASQVELDIGILDPDRGHADRVAHELESLGCQVHRFETLAGVRESAIPSLRVLLVDAGLPEALEAMAWGAEKKLAAVAFSAGGMDEDTLLRRGASFCAQKPLDTQALVTQARFFVSPAPRSESK